MLSKKQVVNKLKRLRREISSIRIRLETVSKEKENWYQQKQQIKKQIDSQIKNVKKIKNIKKYTDKTLKKFKDERNKYNKEVQEQIKKIKELNKEKRDIIEKYKLKSDPVKIKEKIKELQLRIETEGLKFDKEKEIMKQIHFLESQYGESKKFQKVFEQANSVSAEIEEAKKHADDFHNKLKEQSKKIKDLYATFMNTSKEILELKNKEENAFQHFINLKGETRKVNDTLKNKLIESRSLREELDKIDKKIQGDKEKEIKRALEVRTREVEDKLKKKIKLTTEDILAYQGKG